MQQPIGTPTFQTAPARSVGLGPILGPLPSEPGSHPGQAAGCFRLPPERAFIVVEPLVAALPCKSTAFDGWIRDPARAAATTWMVSKISFDRDGSWLLEEHAGPAVAVDFIDRHQPIAQRSIRPTRTEIVPADR